MRTFRWSRLLLNVFALQPGQAARTFLVAIYLLLIIAAYLMLKSASKSLFLERLGALRLPYATIATALLVGAFVALYIRAARRTVPHHLVIGTLLFFVSNLIAFRWLDRFEPRWLYPGFYVWVGMFGVIATTQVWTLANEVFTTREAKRVFGIIGSGGITGAISGGMITRLLAPRIGTLNLLLVAALLLTIAAGIVVALIRYRLPAQARADDMPPPRRLLDSLGVVGASPHLRLVAGLVLITALTTKMVDWQFNAIVEQAFDQQDARTAFFGTFDAATGLIGFLIQVFLTSRLLMWAGLGGAILVFPVALTAGTLALIPTLSLWAATLAKGSDQTLKHSVDRSSRELVYLPVNRNLKVQAKSAIDMVVDRSGDGLAGFVQLAAIALLSMQGVSQLQMVRQMGVINLFFLGTWLVIAIRLRKSYVSELSNSIADGRVEVESWHESLGGAEALTAARHALEHGDERSVLAALELAQSNTTWDLTESLCKLAHEGTPEVRARALAILLDPANPDVPPGVAKAFALEDQELLRTCIDLQLASTPEEREQHAEQILSKAGGPARGAWIALMVRRLGPEFHGVARGLFAQLLDPDAQVSTREVAATALGMLPVDGGFSDLLPELLADPEPRVASAAARSAAAIGDASLLRRIVPLLGKSATRSAARLALQSSGARAVPMLVECARDETVTRRARSFIPNVLAGLQAPEAVRALTELVADADNDLARGAGDALYRIRLKRPHETLVPKHHVRSLVKAQAERCRWSNSQLARLEAPDAAARPVRAMLSESLLCIARESHASIFDTLALCYSPTRMLNCRESLLDGNRELRANAAELLDNLTPRRLWRELLPILAPATVDGDHEGPGDDSEALQGLLECENPWIQACALTIIGRERTQDARQTVERCLEAPDAWVREAAQRALQALDRDPASGAETSSVSASVGSAGSVGDDVRTVVDKVMVLRGIDAFRHITPEQLAPIAAVAQECEFPAGATLCKEGEPPGDLLVVLSGNVRIERNGKELGKLPVGDALGTWGLFEDEPSAITAVALNDVELLRVDRNTFEEVLDEHPEIARSLIRHLIRHLRSLAEPPPNP